MRGRRNKRERNGKRQRWLVRLNGMKEGKKSVKSKKWERKLGKEELGRNINRRGRHT